MAWSARIWLVGFAAALNLAVGACSSSWPSGVTSQSDRSFASHHRVVRTVDVLPMDVQLWTYPGNEESPDALQAQLSASTRGSIEAAMASRGYLIESHIGWGGDFVAAGGDHRTAMTVPDLNATMYSMSAYGTAVEQAGGELLIPYLPARLGTATGSDATLYVGGWSYVGEDSESSTGSKVAKGILIGALIAVVLIVVIIAAKEGGGGGIASGAGKVAASAGKAAVKATGHLARAAGQLTGDLLGGVARAGADVTEGVVRGMDAFGNSSIDTHLDLHLDRPDYYQQPRTPKKGTSATYLEMTLIDNRTGHVLWHARQRFPASARKPAQLQRAVNELVASMP